ncbi:MAG TPA: hypothetical protein VJV78_27295 [Polyangiales bacterium]|nr:hypothetical protein [Polyangiales bacterium]
MSRTPLYVSCFVCLLAACSADTPEVATGNPPLGAAGRAAPASISGATAGTRAGVTTPSGSVAPSQPSVTTPQPPAADGCGGNGTFKKEGCPCRAGETAACWTGSASDRNMGKCHDGLQVCSGNAEFGEWGPCNGEELSCGTTDAGTPPPPPPPGECPCVPGAIIQCSEDCTVGIICSLTASKTCLPDGTWSVCREDLGVTLDLPGIQCRNMLHGCLSDKGGEGEIYVGDCSKQFSCGRAPGLL